MTPVRPTVLRTIVARPPWSRIRGRQPRYRWAALLVVGLLASVGPGVARADEIGDKRAEASRIAARLQELTERQIQLAEDFNLANLRLDAANRDITDTQHRIDAAEHEVDTNRQLVRRMAISAYVSGNDSPSMDVLLTSRADQAPQKKGYLDAASADRQDALDRLAASRARLDTEIEALARSRADAQAARDQADQARRDGERAISDQQSLQARVQGELGTLVRQEQAHQAEQRRRRIEADLRARGAADLATAGGTGSSANPDGARNASTNGTNHSTTTDGPGPAAPSTRTPPAVSPTTSGPPSAQPSAPSVPPASGTAARAASVALSQLGVPYVFGGASPAGFDCSGLVMWSYAQVGVSLPHATGALYAATRPISMSELQVGDLIFFYGLGHVGIFIGGGRVVHAPHTGDVVRIEQVANMPVTGARRVG